MKNYLISICILAVCYFLGAFINWDVNAGNWSDFSRFGVVVFWAFLCFLLAAHDEERK